MESWFRVTLVPCLQLSKQNAVRHELDARGAANRTIVPDLTVEAVE
jgi:hypothetical protein